MEDHKENIQQQPVEGDNRGIKTPEPPQRKDPSDRPASDHESKLKGGPREVKEQEAEEKKSSDAASRQPKAEHQQANDRGSQQRQGPSAPGESEQDAPTTTTNRNSY